MVWFYSSPSPARLHSQMPKTVPIRNPNAKSTMCPLLVAGCEANLVSPELLLVRVRPGPGRGPLPAGAAGVPADVEARGGRGGRLALRFDSTRGALSERLGVGRGVGQQARVALVAGRLVVQARGAVRLGRAEVCVGSRHEALGRRVGQGLAGQAVGPVAKGVVGPLALEAGHHFLGIR